MTTQAAKATAAAAGKTPQALGTEPEIQAEPAVSEDERLAQGEADRESAANEVEALRAQLAVETQRRLEAEGRFAGLQQYVDPSQVSEATSEFDLAVQGKPADEGGVFTEDDTHRTWRIVARNPNYGGETEGFTFSRGESIATGLPSNASPERVRVRQLRLNGLRNYDFAYRTKNARGQNVTRVEPGYRVLTEEQYEAEYRDRIEDGDELPEDL